MDVALVIAQEGQDDPVSLVSFRIDEEYDEEECAIEFQGRNSVLGAPVLEGPWYPIWSHLDVEPVDLVLSWHRMVYSPSADKGLPI